MAGVEELAEEVSRRTGKPVREVLKEIWDTHEEIGIITPEAAACLVWSKYGLGTYTECWDRVRREREAKMAERGVKTVDSLRELLEWLEERGVSPEEVGERLRRRK